MIRNIRIWLIAKIVFVSGLYLCGKLTQLISPTDITQATFIYISITMILLLAFLASIAIRVS